MSQYILSEAYSKLYNPRLTNAQYYDNLRFIDNLTQPEIQEVMESLIWEFMDYGDTLDEAVNVLQEVFREDGEALTESLDFLCEQSRAGERRMAQRKETRERQKAETEKVSAEKAANISDTARRARRAERSAMIRGALSGAKRNVMGALKGVHKKVTDARSKLAAKGSSAALRAQAALSKVSRMGRGAVKGAIAGARKEYNTPSKAPSSRIPGRQQSQKLRAAARKEMGDVFSEPSKPSTSKIDRLRAAAKASKAKVPQEGRTIHGGPAPKPPGLPKSKPKTEDPWNSPTVFKLKPKSTKVKDVTKAKPALPSSGKSSGSTKGGRVLTASQRRMKNVALSRRLGEDIDFNTLTQFMIEDIINEGYVDTEEDALFILDNMNEETLMELAEAYLED